MKAIVFEDIEQMVLHEVPTPRCEDDGLLIKVKACAICGTDTKIFHSGHRHIKPPRITGHEVSGEILEMGKNVKDYQVGQRVAVADVYMDSAAKDLEVIVPAETDGREADVVITPSSSPEARQAEDQVGTCM